MAGEYVAGLARPRISARIPKSQPRCIRCDYCSGRAASRHYGTVTSANDNNRKLRPIPPPVHFGRPAPDPWQVSPASPPAPREKKDPPGARLGPKPYIPSVLLPLEASKSNVVHKIHILGEDERSKFLAHVLSGVYNSVEMLGLNQEPSSSRYRYIRRKQSAKAIDRREPPKVVPNKAVEQQALEEEGVQMEAKEDNSHIDQLIVTGNGYKASKALESVKHRVDENTTVCLMNDGLGVLEDVRRRIFKGEQSEPNFLLGHMGHKLVYHRKTESVRQLKYSNLMFTMPEAQTMRTDKLREKVETRVDFVDNLATVKDLHTRMAEYDQWLHFKLPSVVFSAVADSVCALLDLRYHSLLQNPSAKQMMNRLLDEIGTLLNNMPELQGSVAIRDFTQGTAMQRGLYRSILAKRGNPSPLVKQIERALPTDVDYMNGYFIQRAEKLGLDLRYNTMMRDMIKAKHSVAVEKLNSDIPFEETSIPSELGFRYRTDGNKRAPWRDLGKY